MSSAADDILNIIVPAEQEGTKAVVKAWLKQIGDRVSVDEPLVELETDKVVVEIPAPGEGVLTEIMVRADADAFPGMILGQISVTKADNVSDVRVVEADLTPAARANRSRFDPELRLSPSVRRLLIEHELDPAAIRGSGRNGRITREDVLAEAGKSGAERSVGKPQAGLETRPSLVPIEDATGAHLARAPVAPEARTTTDAISTRIPHDSMRRKIAEHMHHSLSSAPHVTAIFEADFSAISAHRKANKSLFEAQNANLTYTAYLVAAAIVAMKVSPTVNSRWYDDFLEVFTDVNVGVGTALGNTGLIVPVIHKAQDLSLLGIAARLQDLTNRARAGKLKPSDVQNGTFSISNHGVSGSLVAAPIIIHQPQSAILGVGALEKRVVVRTIDGLDTIQIRPMAFVSLSIDHRVVDGSQTNAWLRTFVDTLEHWPS